MVYACVCVCVCVWCVDSVGPDGRGSIGVDQCLYTVVIPSVGVANPKWGRGCTDSIPDILFVYFIIIYIILNLEARVD